MKVKVWLLLWLGGPALAWCGELVVEPALLAPGQPALVRWLDTGPVTAEVEFNGHFFALTPTAWGGQALLTTDLNTPAGDYILHVRPLGTSGSAAKRLRVVAGVHPEERLTLPKKMVSPQAPAILQRIERERTLLRNIFAQSTPHSVPQSFLLPVSDPIGSAFGLRRILNGQLRSPHAGVDFRSPRGTPVKTSAPGVVAYVGALFYTGLTVVVDHGNGLFSLYCHLESSPCVTGRTLAAAEVLGRVGSTGRSTGAHLHWGVKLRGDRVDPLALTALLHGKKS